jgi:hypothetical protein
MRLGRRVFGEVGSLGLSLQPDAEMNPNKKTKINNTLRFIG